MVFFQGYLLCHNFLFYMHFSVICVCYLSSCYSVQVSSSSEHRIIVTSGYILSDLEHQGPFKDLAMQDIGYYISTY